MTVGVSQTGVPFRSYTAGFYDPNGRRGFSHDPSSGWRQQAMHDLRRLGMDDQNAHVDRSGLYHYQHVPSDYLASQGGLHIGFAPDGFEIHYSPISAISSWQLKAGKRTAEPYSTYDGTFEEDFEYKAEKGTLDKCNGAMVSDSLYLLCHRQLSVLFTVLQRRCERSVHDSQIKTHSQIRYIITNA